MAPPGLACMECFKSKCKCVSQPGDGSVCQRCRRLKKQCQPSDSLRKSTNAQRRHNSTARIGDLEGKVDTLVRLLSLVTQSPGVSAALRNAASEDGNLAGYEQLLSEQSAQDTDFSTADAATVTEGSAPITTPSSENTPPGDPSYLYMPPQAVDTTASTHSIAGTPPVADDAEVCLAVFRDKMLPSFSFMDIPPSVTAQQLKYRRPFLMRAIMAVASPSTQQKIAYGSELKRVVAEATLIENKSSLDLLQGLLTFTAWSYDHLWNPSGTLSRLVLLATSLACDLRLDKPLPTDEHMMKPMVGDSPGQQSDSSKPWFVAEEQMAVLACFALSSIISIYFAQIDAMKWKPRMEEALRAIEANTDSLSGVSFAFQVRLQLLAQKTVQLREQGEWDTVRVGSDTGPALSANFYIGTLRDQLHQLAETLPAPLRERGFLVMHMHYIELCMNETARMLYPQASQTLRLWTGDDGDRSGATSTGGNTFGADSLEFSWRSVGAIKAWMDMFFSLESAECAGLSFVHVAQLARCLMVLYRLSTFVHPDWDLELVRSTVDILLVLDGVANLLERASEEAGEASPDGQFMRVSWMMRKFHNNAAAKLGETVAERSLEWSGGVGDGNDGHAMSGEGVHDSNGWQQMMSSTDNAFLESMFTDFGDGWSMLQ